MDFKKLIIANTEKIIGKEVEELIQIPSKSELGDYTIPCFTLAKSMKKAPQTIAEEMATKIHIEGITVKSEGPYINFYINNAFFIEESMKDLEEKYAQIKKDNNVVLIESPGPNTNKPLHLGHLRNILLGSSIFNILQEIGKDAHIVNVVNDRGVHICKSMLAYQKFGEGKTPENVGRKPDHFVGDYYIKFSQYAKEYPEAEKEVQEMLMKWEQDDPEVIKLWQQMNNWAYEGWKETYDKLNFKIEKEYYESETYKGGKDIILKGLEEGIFEKNEDGAIIINLEDKNLGEKVLLRGNGTSVYITQDINMARLRYDDFTFDEMIYVVGNEQEYHFKVLFEVFKKLEWSFGEKCKHFSYGMVELPEGKMKSREGNVVDTDDVLDDMYKLSREEVEKRYHNLDKEEIDRRAKIISNGAVRFFFLKNDALKNFVFNPKESLSFEGETGPYVQYTHARICSILRKENFSEEVDFEKLQEDEEKQIVKEIGAFPEIILRSAKELKPNYIAHQLLALSQAFNSYYVKHKIIQEDKELQNARLWLINNVRETLVKGLYLLGIEAPEEM